MGSSEGSIVEDCRVINARWGGIRTSDSQTPTIRRCFVYDMEGNGVDTGNTGNALVYDNLVADYAQAQVSVYSNTGYVVF